MTVIGVPRESREGEARVGLTPLFARRLTAGGHQVVVERGAGVRAGFADQEYVDSGAQIVFSPEEVFWRADLIAKVSRPTEAETALLREGSALLGLLHLASARRSRIETLLERKITAIALETIDDGQGDQPIIHAMSAIGGRMTPGIAARLLEIGAGGNGVLLSGVPGVPPAEVVVIGAGVFGQEAARAFLNVGASVTVLDSQQRRLAQIEERTHGHVVTMPASEELIGKALGFADVVVTAAAVSGTRAPLLVSEEQVRLMRPGSVIIDAAIDLGGNVATSRPTTHGTPTFSVHNVTHYCVPNMPAAVARTATHALALHVGPLIELLASYGVPGAVERHAGLASGVWTHEGQLMSEEGGRR